MVITASAYVACTTTAGSIQNCSSAVTIFSIKIFYILYSPVLFSSGVGGGEGKKLWSQALDLACWAFDSANVCAAWAGPHSCQRKPLTGERQPSALGSPSLPTQTAFILNNAPSARARVSRRYDDQRRAAAERQLRGRRESAAGDWAAAGTGGPAEPQEPAQAGQQGSAGPVRGHQHMLGPATGCVTLTAPSRAVAVTCTRRVQDYVCIQTSRDKWSPWEAHQTPSWKPLGGQDDTLLLGGH